MSTQPATDRAFFKANEFIDGGLTDQEIEHLIAKHGERVEEGLASHLRTLAKIYVEEAVAEKKAKAKEDEMKASLENAQASIN